ncbi:refilin-B-like isoform X2 [Oncorhynchus masou masou]|uniref:refilin-B-like isoform X2 n=1 Tax=Oncorhynchus masou masou TaxID=90313 RepID=UPI0031830923
MVGRLNLLNVCDDEPLDMSCKAERGLDSPDSGLPPSPSPSHWLLTDCGDKGAISPVSEDERTGSSLVPILSIGSVPQLHTLSYGEGIELDPLPSKEIRASLYPQRGHAAQRPGSGELQPDIPGCPSQHLETLQDPARPPASPAGPAFPEHHHCLPQARSHHLHHRAELRQPPASQEILVERGAGGC